MNWDLVIKYVKYLSKFEEDDELYTRLLFRLIRIAEIYEPEKGKFNNFLTLGLYQERYGYQLKCRLTFVPLNGIDIMDEEEKELPEISRKTLDYREHLIIEKRFKEGKILEDIGSELGITKERVRQILKRSLAKLKEDNEL